MALTDNPYIGLPLDDLVKQRALYFQAEQDVLKTGKSNAFPGWSISRADLPEIRNSMSLLRIAIDYTSGKLKQVAQVTIDTQHQFARGVRHE